MAMRTAWRVEVDEPNVTGTIHRQLCMKYTHQYTASIHLPLSAQQCTVSPTKAIQQLPELHDFNDQ